MRGAGDEPIVDDDDDAEEEETTGLAIEVACQCDCARKWLSFCFESAPLQSRRRVILRFAFEKAEEANLSTGKSFTSADSQLKLLCNARGPIIYHKRVRPTQ